MARILPSFIASAWCSSTAPAGSTGMTQRALIKVSIFSFIVLSIRIFYLISHCFRLIRNLNRVDTEIDRAKNNYQISSRGTFVGQDKAEWLLSSHLTG